MTEDYPFEIVSKDERKPPLQQSKATRCDHPTVYTSEKYPATGTRYICTECGFGSTFPRDFE